MKSFEVARFDTDGFLQAATRYFNERWKLREFDPSKIILPPHRVGFGWGILMPPASCAVTAQKIFNKLGERFTVWKYTDSSLDDVLDPKKEARSPGHTGYLLWCRPVVEADDCHKNKSANAIAKLELNTMGLAERLLLEDFVIEQGWAEHLDIVNATLCAGSRHSGGVVPYVYWRPDYRKLYVIWYGPGNADDGLRAREVVSAAAPKAAA